MDIAAEPKPSAPLLAVQHAARMLRLGGVVRLEGDGAGLDVLAAESLLADGGRLAPGSLHGRSLALTGQRMASLGIPADRRAVYLLPLTRSDAAPGRLAGYVDPTVPVGDWIEALSLAAPTSDAEAIAAVELCKLAGLLPAAILAAPDAQPSASAAVSVERVMAYRLLSPSTLRPVSEARVPLADAEEVRLIAFRPADTGPDQLAILVGEPEREAAPLTRLHSECFTGDLLASLRCDCGDQLRGAIRRMADEGSGVLLYLAQEGRGIGLTNKLRAYMLQDSGLDTVEANHHLGFGGDERDFWAAAAMLRQLGIERVRLLTNNPTKIAQLTQYGIEVAGRVPHVFEANAHNRDYLLTKAVRSGHMLTVDDQQKPSNRSGTARLPVAKAG